MLLRGESPEALDELADNSIDAIVTDPPYELGFMGKTWDNSSIAYSVALWRECLRVLKPGGHLLAFGGSRTYHRLACAVEDAGFEIRDQIMWLYGSGYPKSLNVSKAIDKAARAQREVIAEGTPVKRMISGADQNRTGSWIEDDGREFTSTVTVPATPLAQQWQGWGTALKPAHEPIVVARKPLTGTVANNVVTYGTGALNIDGCRIESTDSQLAEKYASIRNAGVRRNAVYGVDARRRSDGRTEPHAGGRWPANVIHDGSDEVLAGFPMTGKSTGGSGRGSGHLGYHGGGNGNVGESAGGYGDEGSAARFFANLPIDELDTRSFIYNAKASRAERNAGLEGLPERRESDGAKDDVAGDDNPRNGSSAARQNTHPTVKPLALMRYLVRLVTPPGGVVLDPFLGSGTTAVAAILEGFEWIGVEKTAEYWPIIEARVRWGREQTSPTEEVS